MLSKVTRGASTLSRLTLLSSSGEANAKSIVLLQTYTISKRNFSIDEVGKRNEKPYDYLNKRYGLIGQVFDSTLRKLGENSLIITVEGNFGAGKSEFAKKLAKDIDFVYASEPDLDKHVFKLADGRDRRAIVNQIVGDNEKYHIANLEDWHSSPSFKNTIQLQQSFYATRFMQTRQALLHLLSTGQGVVLERSAFSDTVIGQSLYDNHLLSDAAYRFYMRDLVPNTLYELWKPHVSIYLDKSPEECLKTIKEKGKPFEKNSKVYNLNFLRSVENNYKKTFLPEARSNLHVLTYNSNDADPERVVEDLEMLDFEDQSKFGDWRIRKETTINSYRKHIANYEHMRDVLNAPQGFVEVPELLWYGEEYEKLSSTFATEHKAPEKTNLFAQIGYRVPEKNFF